MMFGILIGNVLFGIISDKYGRKGPLIWAVIIQVISGTVCSFVPSFWLFLLMKLICSIATGGTMVSSFVLVMEVIGAKYRTTAGILYQIPFNLGHVFLAVIGYYFRNWRHFQLVISLPAAFLVLFYWSLPESPRWLLAMGKIKEATEVLEKAAKLNNRPTDDISKNIQESIMNDKPDSKGQAGNILHLFKTPIIRKRTLCISFCWIVCGFCFYGVAQYIGQLGGNIFINVAVSGAVEIPATLITVWFIRYLGRKKTMILSQIGSGISMICISIIPNDFYWSRTLLGCSGMFWLISSFGTIYVYSGELFPTTLRNAGMGFASLTARFGSMVSPFVMGLSLTAQWLPPALFGIVAFFGALVCCLLPETKNCDLPDTIQQAEEIGKSRVVQETEMKDKS